MKVEKQELDNVELKLGKQNAVKAALAASLWSMPILLAWYVLYQLNAQLAPAMLSVSGILVGLSVRVHGKGYTSLFSLVAFLVHALIVISAYFLNLILAEGDTIWAILLLMFYVIGAGLAIYIGRIQIPFFEHKAFFQLCEMNVHSSSRTLRNRWFAVLPIVVFLCGGLLFSSIIALYITDETRNILKASSKAQEKHDKFENKAIDVTPISLDTLSTKDALLHTYAYYSGQLPNEYGYFTSKYPKSTYKAKTILKYLSEIRENARAKYILGLMTIESNGLLLIREAAADGDDYAKVQVAVQYACNGQPEIASDLLRRLESTIRDKLVRKKIDAVFTFGFEDACEEIDRSSFLLVYVTSV